MLRDNPVVFLAMILATIAVITFWRVVVQLMIFLVILVILVGAYEMVSYLVEHLAH